MKTGEFPSKQSNILNYSDESIVAYDDFLSTWQDFISQDEWKDSSNDDEHHNIESFAVQTLSRLVEEGDETSDKKANPFFNSLPNSAIICNADGIVTKANKLAMLSHAITLGIKIDNLNITLENGSNLSTKLKELLRKNAPNSSLSLVQCRSLGQDSFFPLAFMRLNKETEEKNNKNILIIFMDAACNADTLDLFSIKFGLSKAESLIVSSFSSGISLKEIAKKRFRSYTTIRNQFQSILEKTRCNTQTDLLRMLLGISYLLSFADIAAETQVNHGRTQGKKIEVMRPQGRFVDVRLYGDLEGKPFIVIPSLFGMPITSSIESELRSRSLLMIGLWRPGFANTSQHHDSDDYYQCVANDIEAVLNNIGVDQCPFLGRATAARTIFNLAQLIPERISTAGIVNSLVPLPFVKKHKILSKWTKALVPAFEFSPSFAVLILETGRRLLIREGAKRFIKNMYKTSPSDLSLVSQDEVISSLHQGVLLGSCQGFLAPTQDMIDGFKDWSDDARNSQIKVTLLQGRNDPNVSIEASRDFANSYPKKVKLIEFENGGGLLNYSHINEILNWVESGFYSD